MAKAEPAGARTGMPRQCIASAVGAVALGRRRVEDRRDQGEGRRPAAGSGQEADYPVVAGDC